MLIFLAKPIAFYNLFFNFVCMEEIKAWLKRKKDVDEVLRIIPLREGSVRVFVLLPAYDLGAKSLGRILFDGNGCDGPYPW
ncbi:hypothetical protein EOD41_18670 [Mucilaginibacter limnophilus]|uniref:Uncharacterized protein n=1 Tax=Mucilaginibacter limnophilus TaxID=1932778 RepID=A0A437MI38_9SPHI|nr:hypothetical protein [Mucilaginibacter limnophilus]RVT97324.1 hypothetical protein EOD41_18670 [Mucilaginibacter limnophilus]